jgi:hypothetical protein
MLSTIYCFCARVPDFVHVCLNLYNFLQSTTQLGKIFSSRRCPIRTKCSAPYSRRSTRVDNRGCVKAALTFLALLFRSSPNVVAYKLSRRGALDALDHCAPFQPSRFGNLASKTDQCWIVLGPCGQMKFQPFIQNKMPRLTPLARTRYLVLELYDSGMS